ncbi:hypothetical protein HY229_06425 [Candidatus Acetothermia bacterium]|nr:hypothetical protein [Candidatus Acetothermia bacterium]MBI3643717.1 hypothetical protein [Candidatus Acetothermia bacterium]
MDTLLLSNSGESVVYIFVLALVLIGFFVSSYIRSIRGKTLGSWANAHNLSFDEYSESSIDETYPHFECLQKGEKRYSFNRITGKWREHDFFGFDYHYRTGSGKSTTHHYFSAVILTSPIPLKPLFIRPEGMMDKVTEFFGAEDINFESREFSQKFFVRAPDKKWAFDVIQQSTMQLMLDSRSYWIQFGEDCVIAYDIVRFSIEDFEQAANVICGILDRLPDYVKEAQQSSTK